MGIPENGSATSRELGRPHPEERACASGSPKSKGRARVSKDEDGGPHASRRIAAHLGLEAPALAFGCDAPQHEGDGARCSLAKRSHVEEPTCGCGKRSLVRLACFRPVLYREPRNFNGSNGQRGRCRFTRAGASRHTSGRRGALTESAPTSRWPTYRREAIMRGPRAPARHVAMTRDEPCASEDVE